MDKKNKPTKLGDILKNITKKYIQGEVVKERDRAYDFRRIFQQMELDLISSMKRAFYFHQNEQNKEGFQWEQWQLTKLREIEKYRRKNKKLVHSYSKPIQEAINRELEGNYLKGQNKVTKLIDKIKQLLGVRNKEKPSISLPSDISEEQSTRDYIAKLLNRPVKPPQETNFFGVNDKKLEALQETVTKDLNKASQAVLRKMDDVYRQTIFKTHVYFQNGTKTLNQAIDMATKDFLDKGINCVEYKNGARVNIASYAEMALRTASHRATLLGEGKKRDEWGLHLVVVSAHANTCKHCEPWQGKVLIDDVFSHPSKEFIEENKQYPLLSEAIEKGLLHPNCRHTLTTYFPGVTSLPVVPDGKEAIKTYEAEQKQRALEREIRKWKRVEAGACDVENQEKAHAKVRDLENRLRDHLENNPQLRRETWREEPGLGITNKDIKFNAERLKQKALDDKIEETRNKILNDEYNLKVRDQKQKEHILGTEKWKDYFKRKVDANSNTRPTMFNKDIDVQNLINEYKGTGIVDFNKLKDEYPREYIDTDKVLGKYWDDKEMKYKDATRFVIIYSSKGTHAFPIRPLKKGE